MPLEGFRISVNLSHFFSDHRNRIRLFIGRDMKKIEDIENKIKNIFGIENIYLTSQNEYLPTLEDVRILQNNEVIWVLPNSAVPTNPLVKSSGQKYSNQRVPMDLSTDTDTNRNTQDCSKKRFCTDESLNLSMKKPKTQLSDVIVDCENSCSSKKNKNKHSKDVPIDILDDPVKNKGRSSKSEKLESSNNKISKSNNEAPPELFKSACKMKKSVSMSKINDELIIGKPFSVSKKKNKMNLPNEYLSESLKTNKKPSDYVCKGDLASYKKNMPIPTITDQYLKQNKINIVKIDVVNKATQEQKNNTEVSSCMKHIINKQNSLDFSHDYLDNISSRCLHEGQLNTNQINVAISEGDDLGQNVAEIEQKTINSSEEGIHKPKIFFCNSLDKSAKKENTSTEMTTQLTQVSKETEIEMSTASASWRPKYFFYNSPSGDVYQNIKNDVKKGFTTDQEVGLEEQNGTKDHGNEHNINVINVRICSQTEPTLSNKQNYDSKEIVIEHKGVPDNTENKNTSDNLKDIRINENNSIYQNPEIAITSANLSNATCKTIESSINTDLSCSTLSELALVTTPESNAESTSEISGLKLLSPSPYTAKEIIKKTKQYLGVGSFIEDLRNSNSSWNTLDSDSDRFVTKKRKRTRKRKRTTTTDNVEKPVSSGFSSTPKPINVKACPIMHVKFKYSDEDHIDVITVEKNNSINKEKDKTNGFKNPENDNPIETNVPEDGSEVIELITINSSIDQDSLMSKDILKSPIMRDMLPKIGDIISFKVLRMTDDYTPDISSFITGKVIQYEDGQVLFDIISGIDQCKDPIGKLSTSVEETITTQKVLLWNNLIEPRLLFP